MAKKKSGTKSRSRKKAAKKIAPKPSQPTSTSAEATADKTEAGAKSAQAHRDVTKDNFVSQPAEESTPKRAKGVKYVPNNTRCPACGAKATVTGTKQRIRQMRCGRCLHNFKAVG